MARDRQRRRDRDADVGDVTRDDLEQEFIEDDPVDPLGQAMPNVTEAHLAEAGVPAQGGGLRGRAPIEEVEREPDRPRRGLLGRTIDFMRASWGELRRVQWPDRRQVGQGTVVTLGFVIVAGAYLGLLDAIWQPIVQAIL